MYAVEYSFKGAKHTIELHMNASNFSELPTLEIPFMK